jgi:hypothetical protein
MPFAILSLDQSFSDLVMKSNYLIWFLSDLALICL